MERLQRVLANRGVASRRAAEELIREGRVMVDGVVVTELGTKVDPATAEIRVDRRLLRPQALRYLFINKPSGYITTMNDERGRWTVMQLIHVQERVYPVGRLDRDTEGLLILTNDGEVANRIMHPRYGLEKEYHVRTLRMPHPRQLDQLRAGIRLDDRIVVPSEVRILRENRGSVDLTISIHEGIFHVVRRMMDAVGIEVDRLRRWRVGPLTVQGLEVGEWRDLKPGEVQSLYQALHLDQAAIQERVQAGARRPVMTAQPPLAPLWRSTDPARRIKEDAAEQRAEAAAEREATDQLPRGRYARSPRPVESSASPSDTGRGNPAAADRRRQRAEVEERRVPAPLRSRHAPGDYRPPRQIGDDGRTRGVERPAARRAPVDRRDMSDAPDNRPFVPTRVVVDEEERSDQRPRRESADWGITKAPVRPEGRRGRIRPERHTKATERRRPADGERTRGTERPPTKGKRSDEAGRAPAWRGRGPGRPRHDEPADIGDALRRTRAEGERRPVRPPRIGPPDGRPAGGRRETQRGDRRNAETVREPAGRSEREAPRPGNRGVDPTREEKSDRRHRPSRSAGPRRPFDKRAGRRTGKPRPSGGRRDRRAGRGGQDDGS